MAKKKNENMDMKEKAHSPRLDYEHSQFFNEKDKRALKFLEENGFPKEMMEWQDKKRKSG